jgi:hypothetical protein
MYIIAVYKHGSDDEVYVRYVRGTWYTSLVTHATQFSLYEAGEVKRIQRMLHPLCLVEVQAV